MTRSHSPFRMVPQSRAHRTLSRQIIQWFPLEEVSDLDEFQTGSGGGNWLHTGRLFFHNAGGTDKGGRDEM